MPVPFPQGRPIGLVEIATNWAVGIAEDDSHGYSQVRRFGNPDYDCSSLVILAYDFAFNADGKSPTPRTAGASYTGNMYNAFLSVGFMDVTSTVNLISGEGMIRGDVLLNVSHHTAMYVGDYHVPGGGLVTNQMVQASIDEVGGITGPRGGDQTGREIYVGNYRNYSRGWNYVLRYPQQASSSSNNQVINLHPEVLTPYIAILDEYPTTIDYHRLRESKVSGMMFCAGALYDDIHNSRTYTNPYLRSQVAACDIAGLPYGLYCKVRARTHIEADAECKALYYVLDAYPPKLGVWLAMETGSATHINDDIINLYHDRLTSWGFANNCGLYVTPTQLSHISWNRWEDKFYLMEIDHDVDLSTLDNQILTPEMFEVPD